MSVVVTDDFNRADAANPGANWTKAGGSTFNLRIVSNQLEANNDPSMMAYTGRTADQDGKVGITLKTLATTVGQGMGPARRVSIAANTGYFAVCYTTGITLYKVVADGYTSLSTYTGTISTNDIIELKATGSATTALNVYQNGVSRITASDSSSPITSGSDGAFGSIDGAIHPTGDDWYVDNLAVAATTSRRSRGLFHPGRRPDKFGRHIRTRRYNVAPTIGAVTGTGSITNGSDTLAASGTPVIKGTAAIANGSDTLAAAGTPVITGTAAPTNGNDTLGATGGVQGPGPSRVARRTIHPGKRGPYNPLRFQRPRRNQAAPSATVTGTASITNGDDTLAAAGTPVIKGSASITNGSDTLASSGTGVITATAAITNRNDTLSAAGSPVITGTASITNQGDTLSAAGTLIVRGTAAITNRNDSLAASGTVTVKGTASILNGNDTLSAAGYVGTPPVATTTESQMYLGIAIRIAFVMGCLSLFK